MTKAIILADGIYFDFVPFSLEKPKGLWEVRGEVLVERLIRQLKEAGINDITLVLGFRKEQFSYLENSYGVKFIFNENFKSQNPLDMLSLSDEELKETIIVSSTDYYIDNPFADGRMKPDAVSAKISTVDELREFDPKYQTSSGSSVLRNIRLVLCCNENEISGFTYLDREMTNMSFVFEVKGIKYIYRYPADGIQEVVSWKNEQRSSLIAKELGIDTTYIYTDIQEGWKIAELIGEHGKPDYTNFEDSKKAIKIIKKLHSANIVTDYTMDPWEDSEKTLDVIKEHDPNLFTPYEELREKIYTLYKKTLNDSVKKCFCHCDAYRPNFMMMPDGSVILIDWEYSAYADPGMDVCYYIVDAEYELEDAKKFILEYLQDDYTEEKLFHFLAYVAIVAYYWFIWALERQVNGRNVDHYLSSYHYTAEHYVDLLLNK